jgi:DNA invertase Pin-like site-specific DNA recombinase
VAIIGYARVSTADQNVHRQTDALEEAGAERVFVDKMSGMNTDRPELSRMLDFIRDGDTLIVESISRLARSARDLLAIVEALRDKGVDLVSQKEAIDTKTPQGRFVLSVFGALAELERETLPQRQREGIEAAKRRGRHMGRPRKQVPANFDKVYMRWRAGELTAVEAQRLTGLSHATFYRLTNRYGRGRC